MAVRVKGSTVDLYGKDNSKEQQRVTQKTLRSNGGPLNSAIGDVGNNLQSFADDLGSSPAFNILGFGLPGVHNAIYGNPQQQSQAMQQGRDHQQYQAEQAAKNQPAPPLSLQDYLNQALGMLSQFGGGDQSARIGGAYDNQIAATQAQGAQGDQVLQQAYANLVAQYANDLPGIQQNYDSAASTIQGNNAAANRDINAGYGASNAAQSDILKNLGIGDAQGVIAQNNFGGNDQAHALANVAQGGASSLNANAENKATASTYNSEAGAAQGVAGAAQRALLQQNLAQTLAQMQSQKASAVAGSQSNNSAQALQLAQYLQQQGQANDPNSLANQQAYAKLLAQQQQDQASNILKQQAITAPLYGTLAKQGQSNPDIIAALKALGLA